VSVVSIINKSNSYKYLYKFAKKLNFNTVPFCYISDEFCCSLPIN
jgi:hypothetical protein